MIQDNDYRLDRTVVISSSIIPKNRKQWGNLIFLTARSFAGELDDMPDQKGITE